MSFKIFCLLYSLGFWNKLFLGKLFCHLILALKGRLVSFFRLKTETWNIFRRQSWWKSEQSWFHWLRSHTFCGRHFNFQIRWMPTSWYDRYASLAKRGELGKRAFSRFISSLAFNMSYILIYYFPTRTPRCLRTVSSLNILACSFNLCSLTLTMFSSLSTFV